MHFQPIDQSSPTPHRFLALTAAPSAQDALVRALALSLRRAYGEDHLRAVASAVNVAANADPAVAARFDLDALARGFRLGLPDPRVEGAKPPQLRASRAEVCELVAMLALAEHAQVVAPVSPQAGKPNPNQPVLGFDGWGFTPSGELVFVLVKGTEASVRPPPEAARLQQECRVMSVDKSRLSRALSCLLNLLDPQSPEVPRLLKALEALGQGRSAPFVMAAVIVRGEGAASLDDLAPVRNAPPAPRCLGVSVSVGAPLNQLAEATTRQARAA